ncbi:tryptophanyl-tRNA synthetase [Kiloniella litopenaei]|uniref:Tryptophan--tRNA ligase n=1 Tax=Kiloniella litopenaei TaxID=1549748 RepID=A0A0M2R5N3_9PROT|nr:tryptophan--tRNA ligase [Kiloniella litopenaei]KKJ77167.1 tryptophanyl-tRNA synthetase [Kiloniella litopenaei]
MKRIFSGVQPTGNLHLGNYLGAIRNFVRLQDDYECIFCVVDMHAITVWQDPKQLIDNTREVAASYLAAGVDPEKHIIFNQSQVSAHAELGWIFNCVSRIGWLNRMTQFKDKAGKNREKASTGLYVYPNLMAADILAYKATHVPVGEDQKQHLELTRDIAIKFNNDFNVDLFPVPEPLIFGAATRIMSLRDGSKKMSKSDPSDYSRITMMDDADTVAKKIKKATSDPHLIPGAEVLDENGKLLDDARKERPEAFNLLSIYAALNDKELVDVLGEFEGKGFADFKKSLTEVAVTKLGPMGSEMKRLMDDKSYVDSVLKQGADRAAKLAEPVMKEVFDAVGFLRP